MHFKLGDDRVDQFRVDQGGVGGQHRNGVGLEPPDDGPALGAAMERLATDPALAERLTAAGYARLGDFSWDRAARDTLAVLEAAAEEGRR